MLKKLIAALCVLASLLTLIVLPAQAADPEPGFRVGYSRVDINPYVVDGDFNSGIMELPLRGTGDVWDRLSSKMVDDNGDGTVTAEDGLKATCIAVSDQNGNTVLLITIDLIGGTMVTEVREEVYTRVQAAVASGELKDVKLTRDQIHYAGTHTHNAPDTTVYNKNGKTGTNKDGKSLNEINTNLGIWMGRTIEDVGDAAILALKDRGAATITKDAISAAADTKSPVKGKVMNSTRHYVNEAGGCVAGDNFNDRGSNPQQVTQVNDTIYLLQFEFADSSKLPIVLANWRGHPSLNNSDTYPNSGRTCLSADYVSAFRHALEYDCTVNNNCTGVYKTTKSCRVAFFQGAGGNVNPRGYEKDAGVVAYGWIDSYAKNFGDSRGNGYGRVLAALAQHGLSSSARKETVKPSEIRTLQQYYNITRRDTGINALAYDAAIAFQALYALDKNTKLPFVYKNEKGETYVIGSRFHASNIVSYWDTTFQQAKSDLASMELCTFLIGENLAFVTISGEAFDYYYREDGVFTAANNLWNDLNTATYGTPFVLGYCNGAHGYVPNRYAYDYNLGSTKWMRGSYESNISPYPQGTGEKMIGILGTMLDSLADGGSSDYEAACQHCGVKAIWKPFNGTSKLTTGHYYLMSDVMTPQIHIMQEQQVCFDLKGYTLRGDTRAIYTYSGGGATFNLMDTSPGQTGKLQGCGGTVGAAIGYGGASILIDKGNVFNFYGGTISPYEMSMRSVMTAGTLRNGGTVNMYGGIIKGGTASSFTGEYVSGGKPTAQNRTGYGGTVYSTGTMNIYGGTIEEGSVNLITGTVWQNKNGTYSYSQTVTPLEEKTAGVYLSGSGKLNVSGNAVVESVCLPDTSTKYLFVDTSAEKFTGKLGISLSTLLPASGAFGKCTENADLSGATITFTNGDLDVAASGSNLVATAPAVIRDLSGDAFHYYGSLQAAERAYTWNADAPRYIRLLENTEDNLQVTKDVYLDLYGSNVDGNVTVEKGSTLYCMDNKTDDYSVADGVYGKLTGTVSGKVEGVPEMTVGKKPSSSSDYRAGYLKLTEADGMSFHCLRLQLKSVALRPSEAGIYYTANINGDEKIQERVESFGMLLNAHEVPYDENGYMSDDNYIALNDASNWNNSNLWLNLMLTGIMKPGNSEQGNAANAELPVYGCAYAKIDGKYYYGQTAAWSLRELAEAADEADQYKNEALYAMLTMYEQYLPVMEDWNLPRLKMEYRKLEKQ